MWIHIKSETASEHKSCNNSFITHYLIITYTFGAPSSEVIHHTELSLICPSLLNYSIHSITYKNIVMVYFALKHEVYWSLTNGWKFDHDKLICQISWAFVTPMMALLYPHILSRSSSSRTYMVITALSVNINLSVSDTLNRQWSSIKFTKKDITKRGAGHCWSEACTQCVLNRLGFTTSLLRPHFLWLDLTKVN